MRRQWGRRIVLALAVVTAAWMFFDGMRSLLVGDFVRIDGQLGPWAFLFTIAGIDPVSLGVRFLFALWGAAWLVACAAYASERRGSERAMLGFAVATLWYLPFGTLFGMAQALLLWRMRPRGPAVGP